MAKRTLKKIMNDDGYIPKAGDEKRFAKKHTDNVEVSDYPIDGTSDVLNAKTSVKKGQAAKTKKTHLSKDEEEAMYENEKLEELVQEIIEDETFNVDVNIIDDLEIIAEGDEEYSITLNDNSEVIVDAETAATILNVYEGLNVENQEIFISKLNENEQSFLQLLDFTFNI